MRSPSFSSSPSRSRARPRGWCAALGLAVLLFACRTSGAGTTLRIEAPEADQDADVFVDGNYVGQVNALGDEPVGPVLLAPGVHRVEVRKPGRFPVQRTLRVDGDTPAETILDAELLPDPQ